MFGAESNMMGNNSTSENEDQGRWFKLFFLLILLLLFSAALLSYSPTDSSILYGGRTGVADNLIGWAGAWVSHLLFLHMGIPRSRAAEHSDHGLIQEMLRAMCRLIFGFIMCVQYWCVHHYTP